MQLNGNQVEALCKLRNEEEFFWFSIEGTDPLDRRVVEVKCWSFYYDHLKIVRIDQNGSVLLLHEV